MKAMISYIIFIINMTYTNRFKPLSDSLDPIFNLCPKICPISTRRPLFLQIAAGPPSRRDICICITLRVGRNFCSKSHYVQRAVNRQPGFRLRDSQSRSLNLVHISTNNTRLNFLKFTQKLDSADKRVDHCKLRKVNTSRRS